MTKVEQIKAELQAEQQTTLRRLETIISKYVDVPHSFQSSHYSDSVNVRVNLMNTVTGKAIFGSDFSVSFDSRNGVQINHGSIGPFSIFNNSQVDRIRVMDNICKNGFELDTDFRTIINSSDVRELQKALDNAKLEVEIETSEFIDKVASEIEVGMVFSGINPHNQGRGGMLATVTKLTPKRVHVEYLSGGVKSINRRLFAENIYSKIYELTHNPNVKED
jgi:hypothetical protein